MIIEKISDTQIKIVLSRVDMDERNIDLSDVLNCTDKARALLYELIERAQIEFSFEITGEPLAIEVIPTDSDGYILIITRVPTQPDNNPIAEDTFSLIAEIARIAAGSRKNARKKAAVKQRYTPEPEKPLVAYSFSSLDDVISVSDRLQSIFAGESMLARIDKTYYLVLNNSQITNRPSMKTLESILYEYGVKQTATELTEHYLKEHGEIILDRYATVKLAGL